MDKWKGEGGVRRSRFRMLRLTGNQFIDEYQHRMLWNYDIRMIGSRWTLVRRIKLSRSDYRRRWGI